LDITESANQKDDPTTNESQKLRNFYPITKFRKMFGLKTVRPVGKLICHVVEGKEMPAMDIGGKSDCYIKVAIGKFEHKSKVQMATLTPIWNEKFDVDIASMNDTIIFSVFDWDRLSRNDLIGKVEFKLSNLKMGKNDLWLQLPQINNKFPQIHVVLQIQPKIVVTVIEGKDLPAMDIGGKSDPFVELVLQNNLMFGTSTPSCMSMFLIGI
jgi:Ca2+-dependent lipid-binding protein